MRKLLKVNFVTLFRNLGFWIALVATCFVEWLFLGSTLFMEEAFHPADIYYIFSSGLMFQMFFTGVLIPFIVGYDFSGGMIRNKILSGATKEQIYFSNLIVSITAAVILFVVDTIVKFIFIGKVMTFPVLIKCFSLANFSSVFWSIFVYNFLAIIGITVFSLSLSIVIQKTAVTVVALIGISFAFTILISPMLKAYSYEDRPSVTITNYEGVAVTVESQFYIENQSLRKIVVALESADFLGAMNASDHPAVAYTIYSWEYFLEEVHEDKPVQGRYFTGVISSTVVLALTGIAGFKKRNLK